MDTKQEYFLITSTIIKFNSKKDLQGNNFSFKMSNMDSSSCRRNDKPAVLIHSRIFIYTCSVFPFLSKNMSYSWNDISNVDQTL